MLSWLKIINSWMQSLITDGSKEHHSIALLHEIIGQVGISNHMRKALLLPAWNMARKGWGGKVLECALWKKNNKVALLWAEHDFPGPSFRTGLEFQSAHKLILHLSHIMTIVSSLQKPRLVVEPATAPVCWSYSHYPAPSIPGFFSRLPEYSSVMLYAT